MRGRGLLLGLVGAVVMVITPVSPVHAATPALVTSCGQHLTTDALLTRDLSCGPNEGLSIAPGTTLDLGGHTVAGDGTDYNGHGIRVTGPGRSGGLPTTIRNGAVSGWAFGAAVVDADPASLGVVRVDGVWFDDNFIAVSAASFELSIALEVVSSRFTDNVDGVWGPGGGQATVDRSTFQRNTWGVSADSLIVRNSQLADNVTGVQCFDSDVCDLTGNRIRGSGLAGIYQYQNPGTGFDGSLRIVDNIFLDNTTGLDLRRSFVTVQVQDNTFVDNGVGASITDADVGLTRNRFLRNDVGLSAARLEPATHAATITDNYLTRNGDGVVLPDEATPGYAGLGDNRAISNFGWGIYAPGAIDLGGNRALDNGRSPQCVGVRC